MAGTTASRVGSIAIGVMLGIALMALFYRAAMSDWLSKNSVPRASLPEKTSDDEVARGRRANGCVLAIDGEPVRAPPSLAGLADDLRVDDRRQSIEWQENGASGKTAFARFEGGGYESRTLAVVLVGDKAVSVQAAFDTDYGFYLGEVHVDGSSVRSAATCSISSSTSSGSTVSRTSSTGAAR